MKRPKIKICCIGSIKEAKIAIQHGADALGLVGNMPSGPGVISDDLIIQITKTIPPPIASFLLTSETAPEQIIKHYNKVHTSNIQIVDSLDKDQYQLIRDALPHVKLVQVIHVINEDSINEANEISNHVDAILLDSGNPNLTVKELGGTGRTHNWKLSREIVKSISTPVFLAGGINVTNVREAIDFVEPYGIDLCSGVRTNGKLDEQKLIAFFDAINSM